MIRLAILGSTRGTAMIKIFEAIKDGHLKAELVTVISNKADAPILQNAINAGFQAECVSPEGLSRAAYDEQLSAKLAHLQVDLIVLIGYMRILTSAFVKTWQNKIINVHPSLLPAFSGLMDESVHDAVLASKHHMTGCTVHYVTDRIDAGPIIIQKSCAVLPTDTVTSLKARVQALESLALIEAIEYISQHSVENKPHDSH